MTINGNYITTVTVAGAPWDENDVMAYFSFGDIYDMAASDVVTLSGNGLTQTHTVHSLTVTEINAAED